ncbi:MAG: HD domain-containing protein [Proteobacteria bacterium]|nr:MAG: HD domain-containing protein [Pseudomonadota bacterium]
MEYISVRVSTLRPGAKLSFNLYVEFKGAHVKYRDAKAVFEKEIFEKFKAKKIKKVYIEPEEEPLYLAYLDEALDALKSSTVATSEKAEIAQGTLRHESENIGKTLESEGAYRKSEERIQQVVDFMLAEPKALAGMLASAGLSVDESQHGSSVSSLVLGVAVSSKWFSREELTDLAVAGLLHDGGLKKFGFDATTDYEALPKEQKMEYRKHAKASAELVAGKQFITSRVLRIIEDHEEYGEGQGYPAKKRYAKLANDSQIFNICDALDHFAMKQKKSHLDCFDDFVGARGEHFDMQVLELLEKQLRV